MKRIIDILIEIHPEFDFANSENFIEDGFLDSFDMITLVATLDKTYGIKIKGTDIVPENFCNLNVIRDLMKKYGVNNEV